MFPSNEAFERTAANLRGNSRAIIFNYKLSKPFVETQPDRDPASFRQVCNFILDQIAENSIHQSAIGVHDNVIFHIRFQTVSAFVDRRMVQLHQLLQHCGKVYRAAIQPKRAGLCFRHI
jgi:hypothetical protein